MQTLSLLPSVRQIELSTPTRITRRLGSWRKSGAEGAGCRLLPKPWETRSLLLRLFYPSELTRALVSVHACRVFFLTEPPLLLRPHTQDVACVYPCLCAHRRPPPPPPSHTHPPTHTRTHNTPHVSRYASGSSTTRYTVHKDTDAVPGSAHSTAVDIAKVWHTDVGVLQALCNADPMCVGFNTGGWLKNDTSHTARSDEGHDLWIKTQ
jgi:hypothetical protein